MRPASCTWWARAGAGQARPAGRAGRGAQPVVVSATDAAPLQHRPAARRRHGLRQPVFRRGPAQSDQRGTAGFHLPAAGGSVWRPRGAGTAVRRGLRAALWPCGHGQPLVRGGDDPGAAPADGRWRDARWPVCRARSSAIVALVAIHESPAQAWTLEDLADVAGMSRSVFAASFREAMGTTPGQYLQGWRVGLAQQALRQGRPLKRIADDVGYGSEAALSRAFKAHTGQSPRQWRGQARATAA